jgi:hypothetical protein
MRFGDDWPGVFIRGDNAFGFAVALDLAIKDCERREESLEMQLPQLHSLRELLVSCVISEERYAVLDEAQKALLVKK